MFPKPLFLAKFIHFHPILIPQVTPHFRARRIEQRSHALLLAEMKNQSIMSHFLYYSAKHYVTLFRGGCFCIFLDLYSFWAVQGPNNWEGTTETKNHDFSLLCIFQYLEHWLAYWKRIWTRYASRWSWKIYGTSLRSPMNQSQMVTLKCSTWLL